MRHRPPKHARVPDVETTEDERFAILMVSERGQGTDGNALFSAGQYVDAANRYLDSLKYSVGVFHADFKKAKAISFGQLDAE